MQKKLDMQQVFAFFLAFPVFIANYTILLKNRVTKIPYKSRTFGIGNTKPETTVTDPTVIGTPGFETER